MTAASITDTLVARLTDRVSASTSDTLATVDVYGGGTLAKVPHSTPKDVADAVEAARVAQKSWATVLLAERIRIFDRFHSLVLEHAETLYDLLQAETGKARKDAFLEVSAPLVTVGYYARKAAGLLEPRRREGMMPVAVRTTELRSPKGVVGIITPWNYPFALAFTDLIPALIAGNAVVLKPDTQTALTTLFGVDLLYQAGLPQGLLRVVLGDGPVVGTALVDTADYIGFTGSTRTGRQIAERAGQRLIGCSLELGGKNPLLVLEDANLHRAAVGAAQTCFSNSGQLCMSPERVFVHTAVYDAFVAKFLAQVRKIKLTATYDFAADMGSLISQRQLETVVKHVEDARSKGATVLAGGKPRPDIGPFFYEPTVLTDVTPEMLCYDNETFGPVVSIYRVVDENEAVERANETVYGLNASVFGRDVRKAHDVAARLRAGTVNINDGHVVGFGSADAPMGGMKDSGLGRRNGAEGLLKYTEAQNVSEQRVPLSAPPGWLPYTLYTKAMRLTLRLFRRLGLR
ncbi:succinic semialdehyde dehydrogenase [Actinocrispum wychmicini]|uniref:Aldehyde dehydrogenase (NAD+)/succinate-semialdehyde dehydrogenase/glutarate-semialdehyde dehydrogenase n=1 Tax=Actinocrispum wychmicini TaxID=1213861 RepID=A0A4R2K753_9PSEU|nr:succinic semialdehyde dehydrogenase [Actinocrispum wychmicini]TCO65796.1 aldehyde dehydrogenase (NAD+)/succinate-semialdehyde dehydrogenase/glutarate-semialdehyde dehydrogenase [Actinocrispum wychmicini]